MVGGTPFMSTTVSSVLSDMFSLENRLQIVHNQQHRSTNYM